MKNNFRLLHLDIETYPHEVLAWGLYDQNIAPNQVIEGGRVLCWGAKWEGEAKILFDSSYQSSYTEMIKGIHSLMNEADALCHYNGRKFDIPVLNREFLLLGLSPPSPSKQIDLLATARRVFRFPSNKLEYISQELGIGEKVRHEGMPLWRGCMRGDPSSWRRMELYNRQDVRLLARAYTRLRPWIVTHPNMALYGKNPAMSANGKLICPRCGGKDFRREGHAYTQTLKYSRYSCRGCGKWVRGRKSEKLLEQERPLLVDLAQV